MQRAGKESVAFDGISPRSLGWQPSSVRTALIDEPLAIRVREDPQGGTLYLCTFRPLKGEWLGQALSSATAEPDKPVSSRVIRGDWTIYQDAREEQERIDRGELSDEKIKYGHAQLLRRHMTDPTIGRSMGRFGSRYVDRWITALDANNAALQKAFRPLEIIDGRFFPEVYIHEREDTIDHIGAGFLHKDPTLSLAVPFREKYYPDSYGKNWRKFGPEEFFEFAKWLEREYPDEHRLRSRVLPYITLFDRVDIIDTYPLDRYDRWSFDLSYAYINGEENSNYSWISSDHERRWPGYTITDSEITLYEADTHALIHLERTDDRARPFRIVGQQVNFADTTHALSPAIAWRLRGDAASGGGSRELLTHAEMREYFPEFGDKAFDDLLGLVTIVGFMPTVRSGTPAQMHLENEREVVRQEGGQYLSAAQIPVYYGLPDKREQIAQDSDGVLESIEALYSHT